MSPLNFENEVKVRFCLVDEAISLTDGEGSRLWQKALWAKKRGYEQEYPQHILPVGEDDFIAAHLIVAEELTNGELEPMFMYKSIRLSQCKKFDMDFPFLKVLRDTEHENSFAVKKILNQDLDISYDSSWTINPVYKKRGKDFCKWLRDLTTVYATNYHRSFGIPRWVTYGATKFKIDKYFEYLGGKEFLPEFTLPHFDKAPVRGLYIPDTNNLPQECMEIAERYMHLWNNLTVFSPNYKEIPKKLVA